jgi:hypothetical protein
MATDWASHVRQVKGYGPDRKGHPGPPDWGLDVGLTTTSRTRSYVEKTSIMPRIGSTNRRRTGYKEKDLIFGTCNIRTLSKTGALISFLSQLKRVEDWHNTTTGNNVAG